MLLNIDSLKSRVVHNAPLLQRLGLTTAGVLFLHLQLQDPNIQMNLNNGLQNETHQANQKVVNTGTDSLLVVFSAIHNDGENQLGTNGNKINHHFDQGDEQNNEVVADNESVPTPVGGEVISNNVEPVSNDQKLIHIPVVPLETDKGPIINKQVAIINSSPNTNSRNRQVNFSVGQADYLYGKSLQAGDRDTKDDDRQLSFTERSIRKIGTTPYVLGDDLHKKSEEVLHMLQTIQANLALDQQQNRVDKEIIATIVQLQSLAKKGQLVSFFYGKRKEKIKKHGKKVDVTVVYRGLELNLTGMNETQINDVFTSLQLIDIEKLSIVGGLDEDRLVKKFFPKIRNHDLSFK